MEQKSPQWKKPSDVMRIRSKRIKRARSEECIRVSAICESSATDPSQTTSSQTSKSNPFAAGQGEQSKKICRRHSFITDGKSSNRQPVADGRRASRLLEVLRQADKPKVDLADIIGDEDIVIEEDDIPTTQSRLTKPAPKKKPTKKELILARIRLEESQGYLPELQSAAEEKPAPAYLASLPTDWSLKVKMRVTSGECLECTGQLKHRDEALSIKQHLAPSPLPGIEENKKASFHSCCMYWLHPSLPWLRLFPRVTSEKFHKAEQVPLSDGVRKSLRRAWCEAFSSVYHLVRSGHCPYFYLCAHHVTALFRAAGVAGQPDLHALVTPTTRGFRENLKREGVEFSMPLLKPATPHPKKAASRQPGSQDSSSEEEEVDLTGEETSRWLADLGLNQADFPGLSPDAVKLQRESYRQVDGRCESLLLVEGVQVQGLFNFLLNSRSCTPTSGPQAGVPPTLLAPAPFHGGTLIPNTVRSSMAKETLKNGKFREVDVLEISGPILPHHTLTLASRLCQQGRPPLTFSYNTHEPSVPFNLNLPPPSTPVPENSAANWNVSPALQEALGTEVKLDKNSALREVQWSDLGFLSS